MLLQIYYKRLNNVCDAAKAFQINVLVVPQHLCGCVADQGEFVLVGGLDVLHEGGEGVTAAVGRVFAALDSVYLCDRIFDTAGIQGIVESFAVSGDGHRGAVGIAEHRAGDLLIGELVDDGLDLGGDGDSAILAGIGLGAADKSFPGAVVTADIQIQQLRGTEAQVTLGHDIIDIFVQDI